MLYLELFEKFVENTKNTPLIFENDEITIKVVKTLDSSKKISDPQWCSVQKTGFYTHNLSANMYRILYKNGYKLRLTWDYLHNDGTHWGEGGKVDGKAVWYNYIRPEDVNNPFKFNYTKNDNRQKMVDSIQSLPIEAINAIKKYQESHSLEKSALYNNLYKEISNIKVINVDITKEDLYIIDVIYKGVTYKIEYNVLYNYFNYPDKFKKRFNNYALTESGSLKNHLVSKCKEWIKANKKSKV